MLTPTILKITVASHMLSQGIYACKSMQESMKGGGVRYVYISRGSGGMLKKFLCHERASGAI